MFYRQSTHTYPFYGGGAHVDPNIAPLRQGTVTPNVTLCRCQSSNWQSNQETRSLIIQKMDRHPCYLSKIF